MYGHNVNAQTDEAIQMAKATFGNIQVGQDTVWTERIKPGEIVGYIDYDILRVPIVSKKELRKATILKTGTEFIITHFKVSDINGVECISNSNEITTEMKKMFKTVAKKKGKLWFYSYGKNPDGSIIEFPFIYVKTDETFGFNFNE